MKRAEFYDILIKYDVYAQANRKSCRKMCTKSNYLLYNIIAYQYNAFAVKFAENETLVYFIT